MASKALSSGQPSVANGHSALENQVSRTSGSCQRKDLIAAMLAEHSVYCCKLIRYEDNVPAAVWREIFRHCLRVDAINGNKAAWCVVAKRVVN